MWRRTENLQSTANLADSGVDGPEIHLVQHFDLISNPHHAFDQDGAVDSSLTFVGLGDIAENCGVARRRFRIDVIMAQRGSRSRTETTAFEPMRSFRPTKPSSANPAMDARSMKTFAVKRRLSRSIPSSSPSRRPVWSENNETGRQSVIAAPSPFATTKPAVMAES